MQPKHITTLSMARSGHNFVLQNVLSWIGGKDLYVHHNLESVRPELLMPNHLKHGGPRLLIWRDFDDWLASSIAKAKKIGATRNASDIPSYLEKIISTYKAIMAEVKCPRYYNADCVIHYDEFVESRSYRESVCSNLNGEYNESELNFVPRNGHYSSFDADRYQGEGSKMNVLNRAEDILNTEYKDIYIQAMDRYGKGIRI